MASHLWCGICARSSNPAEERLVAWRTKHWTLRHHAHPAPLAGWFQLESNRHLGGPADLSDEEARECGVVLRACSQAVREATGSLRVYAIAFGEGAPHLHMHLVPRLPGRDDTAAWRVADWYRAVEQAPALSAGAEDVAAMVSAVGAIVQRLDPPVSPMTMPTGS